MTIRNYLNLSLTGLGKCDYLFTITAYYLQIRLAVFSIVIETASYSDFRNAGCTAAGTHCTTPFRDTVNVPVGLGINLKNAQARIGVNNNRIRRKRDITSFSALLL